MKDISNRTFLNSLKEMGACGEAVVWCKEHRGTRSQLWHDCERGDWMAWWIGKQSKYNQSPEFSMALADCAALSLQYFEAQFPNDKRVRDCIIATRDYAHGKITRQQLQTAAANAAYAAADAAYDAAYAANAAADAAAYAANAAAYDAAYDAANATHAAANAAYAAAYAAAHAAAYDADAAYAAREKTLKKCADIFRKYFKF